MKKKVVVVMMMMMMMVMRMRMATRDVEEGRMRMRFGLLWLRTKRAHCLGHDLWLASGSLPEATAVMPGVDPKAGS